MDDQMLSPADLADMLVVPVSTIYAWRHNGTGPKGHRVGKHVRYRRSDVDAWLELQADRGAALA